MDLNDTPEQAEFRARARAWLQDHRDEGPPSSGSPEDTAYIEARRAWQRRLAEAGLAGVTWPVEYGGQGLGPIEQVTANQEISRAGMPGILDVIGVGMLGPCLIAHGSPEQKSRYLGPLLHADEVWCQMFSEPAAGSDLAAVQTRARRLDDGGWSLTGQKVWTTNAQFASFGLLLARTDPDVPKHKGLTMFIIPMDAPGVTVRGLRQISGDAEFNEVFLDDLILDADAVVGGEGNGWGTALTVLMFERLTIGFGSDSFGSPLRLAQTIADDPAARANADVRHRLGEVITELTAVRFNGYRALTLLAQGQIPGPEAGLAKVTMVNAAIKATDLGADVVGPGGLADDGEWAYLISFLPGLKSAGGTESILRNTIGERVLGLPSEPRLDKGIPFSELRSRESEGGLVNLSLSDEQVLLREAARGVLARVKTIEAARTALEDPATLPDLWPAAVQAGWPGLLISEEHGGAELDAFDAMLVAEECGRVLAPVPLLGMLPATAILGAAGDGSLPQVAAGERRPAYLPARPPGDLELRWTVDPAAGMTRAQAPAIAVSGEEATVDGAVAFVPDVVGADLLVVVGIDRDGTPRAAAVDADAPGVSIESVIRYDATRPLGHVRLTGARGRLLDVSSEVLADAWYLAHALIAADSLGAVQTCLERSVEYAKERHTFGRAIGSYQAVKHELVEILRRMENTRGLAYYAGWARESSSDEFPLAASAARCAGGEALDFATRAMINVHGGIGATWEHDAPLFFRRAELSRRLLAGTADATDRVAERTLAGASA